MTDWRIRMTTASLRADPPASYVCGAGAIALRYQTIGAALGDAALRHSMREALVVPHQQVRWTYAELDARVTAFAAGLIALGLAAGDRIGIWAPNCAEWVVTQLASARAGLILVTINPAYRVGELEQALVLSGCRALVLAQRFRSSDHIAMLAELAPEIAVASPGPLRIARLPDLQFAIAIGGAPTGGLIAFDALANGATRAARDKLDDRVPTLQPDDPINIQFTSGTTGSPKGATLTHFAILNNGFLVGERMGLSADDRLCIPVPLYHCFGMVMGVLNCIGHGATMVFPGEVFDPAAVLETVQSERCTALFGVPTMFVAELSHAEFASFDLSSLRTGVMAGAPCPIAIMKRVISQMNMRDITICYGMTETSPVSFQTAIDADLETRTSTVGTVHPFVEAKIVDQEGRVTALGVAGELLVRGYNVMSGYWRDPERTREAIDAGGWMHTGDLATIDERGRARIVGRVKDMIIRGGENISPLEIEEHLSTLEGVIEVAVFGVAHDLYGEEVCAWIRADPGLGMEDVLAHCRAGLAHYKIPQHVRFVDALPMTVTGKLRKFEMRNAMMRELERREVATA